MEINYAQLVCPGCDVACPGFSLGFTAALQLDEETYRQERARLEALTVTQRFRVVDEGRAM